MARAARHRRSRLPNAVPTLPSGNPSKVFIGVSSDDAAATAAEAITCQVKTRNFPERFTAAESGGLFDVYQVGFDHQQVAFAGPADHVQQPIHGDDLLELLVDEPLQEALRQIVVLLDRDVHQ